MYGCMDDPKFDNSGDTFSQLFPWGSNERLALAESTLRPTAFLFAAGAITKVGIQTRGDDASIYDDDATNLKWLIAIFTLITWLEKFIQWLSAE